MKEIQYWGSKFTPQLASNKGFGSLKTFETMRYCKGLINDCRIKISGSLKGRPSATIKSAQVRSETFWSNFDKELLERIIKVKGL